MRFSIKYLIAPVLLALGACAELEQECESSMGYLCPPSFDVDLSIDSFVQTKAAPQLPSLPVPELSQVTFKVTDKNNNVIWDKKGVWTDYLKLPVGSYTVEASFGTNSYDGPCYSGKYIGTIAAVTKDTPKVVLTLDNAMLAVGLGDAMKQHFLPGPGQPVTFTSASGTKACATETYIFAPVGEVIAISLSGTSSAGVPKTFTYSIPSLTAGTATFLQCGMSMVNLPKITIPSVPQGDAWGNKAYISEAVVENISPENQEKIKYYASSDNWATKVEAVSEGGQLVFAGLAPGKTYTVRAEIGALHSNEVTFTLSTSGLSGGQPTHTFYNNRLLDGTDFRVKFDIPARFKQNITALTINYCKADGTPLRSKSYNPSVNNTNTIEWVSDGSAEDLVWPLLPPGAYKVTGEVIMDGKQVKLSEVNVTSPTIEFTVTAKGTTSYDKYLNRDISAANSMQPETITDISYSVGILDALKMNPNYAYSDSFTMDGTTDLKGKTSIGGCSWAAHELKATATLCGVTVTGTKTCHITGLPYSANPPQEEKTNIPGDHGWHNNYGCTFNVDNVRVRFGQWISGNCHCSLRFYIPGDINITVGTHIQAYNAPAATTTYVDISGTRVAECTANGGGFNYKTVNFDNNANPANATFRNANPEVIAGTTWGGGLTEGSLYNITLKYR